MFSPQQPFLPKKQKKGKEISENAVEIETMQKL